MRKKLNKKLCMDDIYEICILTHGNNRKKAHLYQLTFIRTSEYPQMPVGIHSFDMQNNRAAYARHYDLIDRVLVERE